MRTIIFASSRRIRVGVQPIGTVTGEKQQLYALQKKWGGKIVKIDNSNKGGTKKVKKLDYNPIIRVPIKGV